MAFYGSRGTSCLVEFSLCASSIDMSTAIVRVLTNEGFVIAADGIQRRDDGKIITKSLQKIFPIRDKDKELACALCGTTTIIDDRDQRVAWDLASEVLKSSRSVALRRSKNLGAYATRLCRPINEALKRARKSGRIDKYPCPKSGMDERGTTIAELMLDGYYHGIPSRVSARFFHVDQKLDQPEINQQSLSIEGYYFLGSDKIAKTFANQPSKISSIDNAIEQAVKYISLCASPEGRLIDGECPEIGGHIHVSIITPNRGFYWAPDRAPLSIDAIGDNISSS